jgi:hypothetical protein
MKIHVRLFGWLASAILLPASLFAADLGPGTSVRFLGDLTESKQLSGLTKYGDLLVVCPDEGCQFDVLTNDDGSYRLLRSISLCDADEEKETEIDLEGAASDGEYLYLVGSHSLARRKVESDATYKHNRSRFSEIKEETSRDKLFRLKLGDHGKLKSKEEISLRQILKRDEFLRRFTRIPSKENGVDIEGIAVRESKLYLGFRGPVLRGNYAPVMVLEFDSPEKYELRFVNLGGRGIRDIAAVKDGFLIIAGPVGEADETYELYYWNGKDCIP